MKNFEQTALITGASSGIGYELAKCFAQDGYNLVLVSRNADRLNQIADEFKQQFGLGNVTVIGKDLSQPSAAQEIYDEVKSKGIAINALVNDAGMGEYGMFATETDIQKELAIIQINATSLVYLTKLFLKDMVASNEGKILMLASVASVLPNPLMAVYGATKAFILSFSEALRNELKDTEITVTSLMPGATNTDFFNKAGAEGTVAHKQAQESGDPKKVARDGYKAMMEGKDKIVSGMMNRAQVAMSRVMPDPMVTSAVRKQMEKPTNGYHSEEEHEKQVKTGSLIGAVLVIGLVAWAVYNKSKSTDFDWSDLTSKLKL